VSPAVPSARFSGVSIAIGLALLLALGIGIYIGMHWRKDPGQRVERPATIAALPWERPAPIAVRVAKVAPKVPDQAPSPLPPVAAPLVRKPEKPPENTPEKPSEKPQPEARYQGRTAADWAEQLWDRDVWVRAQAGEALGHFGKAACPYLLRAMQEASDDDKSLLVEARVAFIRIGLDATPWLITGMRSSKLPVRNEAATAFSWIVEYNRKRPRILIDGEACTTAMKILSRVAGRGNNDDAWAVACLGNFGSAAKEFVHLLVGIMEAGELASQLNAVEALGKMGIAAKEALPDLKNIIHTAPQASLRKAAKDAIYVIQGGT
jgi:hypothetical protein